MVSIFLAMLCSGWLSASPVSASDSEIELAARRFRLPPLLVKAMIHQESRNNETVTSPVGAMGLMQVMPGTARELGVPNAYHGLSNLMGGCEYLRYLFNRYDSKLPLVLAAYNAGPARVDKYRGIPPFRETREYVRSVLKHYETLRKSR